MFTGIVEQLAEVIDVIDHGTNKDFIVRTDITPELYIDQSIAHNGVCLTVVEMNDDTYRVTAIKETLDRSNLGQLSSGDFVNLERCVQGMTRMDGHVVQGHVDSQATCTQIEDVDGSWYFTFKINPTDAKMIVDKGSVCINGVSLTVCDPTEDTFRVAIIPYTYEHTTFGKLAVNDKVNIEWDIIGKYVVRYMERING